MNARYEKLDRLGGGGMGVVYRARQIKDIWDREVALKFMKAPPREDLREAYALAFVNEARLCAQLAHKNIVRLLDSGESEEGRFLVFELVRGAFEGGPDVKAVLKKRGALPPELAGYIAAEVLRGLAYAHAWTNEAGEPTPVVHRDISPDNILVDSEGAVRIADFGVARVYERLDTTRSNVFVGKLTYASPERLQFQPVDGRSDVFGVGVVLHEMLTGRALFGYDEDGQRLSDRRIGRQILDGEVRDPRELREGIPAALATACLRMLERDVAKRPTAADAVRALQASRLLDGVDDERLKVWLRTQDATRRIEFADTPTRDDRGAAAMRSTTQSFGWASGGTDEPRLLKWATYALAVVVVVLMAMLVARRLGQGEATEAGGTLPSAAMARDGGVDRDAGLAKSVAASLRDGGVVAVSAQSPRDGGGQAARRVSTRPVRTAPVRRTAPSAESAAKKSPATEPPRDGGATPLDRLFPEGYELPPKPDAGVRPTLDPDALFPEGYDPGR